MKKFKWKLLIFILIPIVIISLLDIILRNQNSLYKEKYQGVLSYKDSIEVIILGNSHANYGVNPTSFDLFAYNLANPSQSLYFDKRITISLMPYLKKIKYVFISIDYHTLYFSSQGGRDMWSYYGNGIKYKNSSYLLANISPTLFGYTTKVSMAIIKKKVFDFLKYGRRNINFDIENGVNLKDTMVRGFIPYEGNNESEFTTKNYILRSDLFNNTVATSNEKKEVLADLDNFLEILLANNITPILFTAPTYFEFNKLLDKSILYDNRKEIKRVCEKFNLKYWDFMNSDFMK